jgi:hypothetical protein
LRAKSLHVTGLLRGHVSLCKIMPTARTQPDLYDFCCLQGVRSAQPQSSGANKHFNYVNATKNQKAGRCMLGTADLL